MTDIKNTEYITINKDGVFVGGKPATHYRGEEIFNIRYVKRRFSDIQKEYPGVMELHVLLSETSGKYAEPGSPSPIHGRYSWYRAKFNDGKTGAWVYSVDWGETVGCAKLCAFNCVFHIKNNHDYRQAVFGERTGKENVQSTQKQVAKSQKPINPVVVAANNEAQNKR